MVIVCVTGSSPKGFTMKKSPFVSVAFVAVVTFLAAILAHALGNKFGAQFAITLSAFTAIAYAAMRITYDLVPARYVRGRRTGRS